MYRDVVDLIEKAPGKLDLIMIPKLVPFQMFMQLICCVLKLKMLWVSKKNWLRIDY